MNDLTPEELKAREALREVNAKMRKFNEFREQTGSYLARVRFITPESIARRNLIIKLREEGKTYLEIAESLPVPVSRERVHQILANARPDLTGWRVPRKRKEKIMRVCKKCNKEFAARYSHQQYCSRVCMRISPEQKAARDKRNWLRFQEHHKEKVARDPAYKALCIARNREAVKKWNAVHYDEIRKRLKDRYHNDPVYRQYILDAGKRSRVRRLIRELNGYSPTRTNKRKLVLKNGKLEVE